MDDFRSIRVKSRGSQGVEINNPTAYELIGKGVQGAVFKLSGDRCVKIYAKEKYRLHESNALKLAADSKIVPKVYEVGPDYIVMEYIKGQTLKDYLKSSGKLPKFIARQLLFVFQEMKKIGFTRRDARLRHMIISNQKIRVIDHVNSLRKNKPWPEDCFRALAKLNLLDSFLKQVKEIDREQYREWKRAWNK